MTKESTEEEVCQFFINNLNFSEDSIRPLGLDGNYLFSMETIEIDDLDITYEEKQIFKQYLNKIKEKPKSKPEQISEPEFKITYDSNKIDVINFLVKKINLKKDVAQKLNLDGKTLLLYDERDIN